ncbi:hypothetical protein DTO006G1_270 [Penicillium roqueforti]|nr:hypothetical protein CBS147337_4905 [Penicillium roqueforti]KAI2726772.1 hypothetical protein CBS147354_4005 [Penicillium roqueforti]KAI2764970.1 hypothetical protein DTO006G1_270 [Penicillium roqueforti]KAI3111797.1 hypothetical protein CBS147333_4090 [Penicillium roqueforti]KAI3256347.1 hypothetical protein DTO006G7_3390 [Penicillium roqueforti]
MAPSAIEQQIPIEKATIKPWSRPAPTNEKLDWAPLVEIDLSRFDEPGGKEDLAKQLYDAVTRVGFWVVVGHGLDDERILRQFSIGNAFFKENLEEKRSFECNFAEGEYFGYRENSRWIGETGVKDNIEMLNIPKAIPEWDDVPKHRIVRQNYDEIASFHRDLFDKVVRKLFVLMAIILELPEDHLVQAHAYDKRSDDHLRYMIYNTRTQEEWDKAQGYTKGGHTDFGSLTLLFSQNVAGFLKSTIHRVVTPPRDQIDIPRLGLLYFCRPGDDTVMRTVPSPLLERLGLLTEEDKSQSKPAPTGTEYVRARVRDVHHKTVIDRRENTSFEFKGLKVPNYYK